MVLAKCQAKKESLKANKKTDLGISLKMTSSLCKMKSKFTIWVKSTANYTHLLYILLTVMEIFNAILFVSSLMITTTIHILFIKHKQSLLMTLRKAFHLWIRSSLSLTAELNIISIPRSKSLWDGAGDLLIAMLQDIVYKDPCITKVWTTSQCLIYV